MAYTRATALSVELALVYKKRWATSSRRRERKLDGGTPRGSQGCVRKTLAISLDAAEGSEGLVAVLIGRRKRLRAL